MEGKKCLLNHMRRTEEAEKMRQARLEMSSTKKRAGRQTSKSRFTLNVRETNTTEIERERTLNDSKVAAPHEANAAAEDGKSEEDHKS